MLCCFAPARLLGTFAPRLMANQITKVPAEQRASYAAIIDEILASADLETISAKRIRNGLQERVDYDLTPQKVCWGDKIAWNIH
jgi:hypothetical protein